MSKRHQTAKIPAGVYCYTLVAVEQRDGQLPVLRTKPCPFLRTSTGKDGEVYGRCRFLKRGDNSRHNPTFLLHDACKECGINTELPA